MQFAIFMMKMKTRNWIPELLGSRLKGTVFQTMRGDLWVRHLLTTNYSN